MTTDKHLARIVGWTVCLLAALSVASLCWQVIHGHKVDPDLHDLVVLLAGGLLGRLTTSRQPEATDSPVPTTVVNPPSDPVPTQPQPPDPAPAPTPPPADAMPDPDGADPGVLPTAA